MTFGERIYGEVPYGEAGSLEPMLAAVLPVGTVSFSGTYVPPTQTGTFAATSPTTTASFSGTYDGTLLGDFAITLTVPTDSFAGSYTPPAQTGSFAATLPLPVLAFGGVAGEASGSLAATLPLFAAGFYGTYGGPYGTDTSNALDGLDLVCVGRVVDPVPIATPPTSLATKYDKALAYPTPTMVGGRPT